MGSSFSIINDTKQIVWVTHEISDEAFWKTMSNVLAVAEVGAKAAGATATLKSNRSVAGLKPEAWFTIGNVSSNLSEQVSSKLSEKKEEKKELPTNLKQFLKKVTPGGEYKVTEALNATKTVYVVKGDGEVFVHDCEIGPTEGSTNEYRVSVYFS